MKASRVSFALAAALVSFAAAAPCPTLAAVKTGGEVQVPVGEYLAGNTYVVAGRAGVAGSIGGDLVLVSAADAVVSGDVAGDLTVLGYQTSVSGNVGGDLRAAGGFVVVSGKISGDLVAAGGRVELLPGAEVGGDLVAAGGEFSTRGTVAGAVNILAGEAAIGGEQGGGTVTATAVTFLADATGGSLAYYAPSPAVFEPGASLPTPAYNQIPPISEIGPVKSALLSFLTLWRFFSFASTLILGLALAYGARVFSQETVLIGSRSVGSFLGSALAGLAAVLLLPIISLLAMASIFALPLGILGLLATAATVVLASALGALVVGFAAERAARRGAEVTVSYRAVGFGAVVVALVELVPGGSIVKLVVALVGVGAAARAFARRLRGDGWSLEKVLSRWGGKPPAAANR